MQKTPEDKIKELEKRLNDQERVLFELRRELQYILREKDRMKNDIERLQQYRQRS